MPFYNILVFPNWEEIRDTIRNYAAIISISSIFCYLTFINNGNQEFEKLFFDAGCFSTLFNTDQFLAKMNIPHKISVCPTFFKNILSNLIHSSRKRLQFSSIMFSFPKLIVQTYVKILLLSIVVNAYKKNVFIQITNNGNTMQLVKKKSLRAS